MTKHFHILMMLLVVAAAGTLPASAGFRIGPRVGLMVNKMKFDKSVSVLNSDNRLGFQGGLQLNYELPVVGLGLDMSVLYARFNSKVQSDQLIDQVTFHRDYLDVPLHLHYAFNIIGVERIVKPYLFTGADFSIRLNDAKELKFKTKSTRVLWDIGFGVELLRHLQVSATYSLSLTDALDKVGIKKSTTTETLEKWDLTEGVGTARDKTWVVSVAYLF